jgi:cytochrome c-type protein NapC
MKTPSTLCQAALLATLASAALLTPAPAHAVDWAKVPARDVVLFYPGAIPLERLLTPRSHTGERRFPAKSCFDCHGDQDEGLFGLTDAGKDREPSPIKGKPAFINAKIRAAHEDGQLLIRIEFNPGKQPDAQMDKEFETKVAVMLGEANVPDFAAAGCYVSCHATAESMRDGVKGTTKYLKSSRLPDGSIRPTDVLDKMRSAGQFLEYWQARINPGQMPVVVDGTILDQRTEHEKPLVTATATITNGLYTVTMSRPLQAGSGYKDIVPGKVYTIGFSIHAGRTSQRFHYVSLERTLALDAKRGSVDFATPGPEG